MLLSFTQWCNVVLELKIIEVISTWGPKYRNLHIWNISKPGCEKKTMDGNKQIKTMHCFEKKKDNLKDKITSVNKRCRICSRVCQCVWGITNFVFLCPCKFALGCVNVFGGL
jgi:hypothetical protein